ncbi:aspartate/glutamate racemase family protein [Neobacillus vireti]|uniref:aspartate/glutamate racemase family protein n=1 Tax=Neobacillus vireti TaxID=220686 RepID=UPI003000D0B5
MNVKKRMGCLHAHYSNIDYIEGAFSSYDIELSHFVDPGLLQRVTNDESFPDWAAEKKVKDQIEWIGQTEVDAILITCTNYIALLKKEQLSMNVPIFLIDEPYFEAICRIQRPQTILFTNPATVSGTMNRLHEYAHIHQKTVDIEAVIIENTFDLIMRGQKEEYIKQVSNALKKMNEQRVVSVAQLSMVPAAQEVERQTSKKVINPLDTLVSSIVGQLVLSKKE